MKTAWIAATVIQVMLSVYCAHRGCSSPGTSQIGIHGTGNNIDIDPHWISPHVLYPQHGGETHWISRGLAA